MNLMSSTTIDSFYIGLVVYPNSKQPHLVSLSRLVVLLQGVVPPVFESDSVLAVSPSNHT